MWITLWITGESPSRSIPKMWISPNFVDNFPKIVDNFFMSNKGLITEDKERAYSLFFKGLK